MYRHGDLLISAIPSIPKGTKPTQNSILARGEVTGHAHRIEPKENAILFEDGENMYLHVIAQSACVVHEEHAPISLPQGFYRVWRQREYVPGAIRRVVD